jgi:hypothetical protein
MKLAVIILMTGIEMNRLIAQLFHDPADIRGT